MASPFVELEVGERVVRVTNPDKVFSSTRGETKLDHVRYYLGVADGIVRALYERPTQLKDHPDGAEGEAIYQKRVPKQRPEWIETARVTFPSGRHADELCVTEVAQVVWAANLGTIDFHPGPRAPRPPRDVWAEVPATTSKAGNRAGRAARRHGSGEQRIRPLALTLLAHSGSNRTPTRPVLIPKHDVDSTTDGTLSSRRRPCRLPELARHRPRKHRRLPPGSEPSCTAPVGGEDIAAPAPGTRRYPPPARPG